MENLGQTPFVELPEALVEEMLSKSEEIADILYDSFQKIQKIRAEIRDKLLENKENKYKYILKLEELELDSSTGQIKIPTTSGVDGAYAIERRLSVDIVACAAVAIEGLTPPSEERHWPRPYHKVFIHPEKHDPDTGMVIRGLMIEMELELAAKAPHDIVFLDGSLTTPLIYINQAINKIIEWENEGNQTKVGEQVKKGFKQFLENYKIILKSTNKSWVGIPKYTTKRELGKMYNWPDEYDDRAILTIILSPGEFTKPIKIEKPKQPWHLKVPFDNQEIKQLRDEVISAIDDIYIIYYRPWDWTPAFRIEVPSSIANDNSRMKALLLGIKHQCANSGIMEPYPLYLADRMVKHIGKGVSASLHINIKKMTELQLQMVELHQGSVDGIFFSMHSYRTENGG
ncbi:DNA double-strand break repair nuclease NurA [Caldisericum sp.]|uniref:DNA double-strand break repair nuclease NurA n=1 Tax=Caldisericum sp. TaxID=2499687 RepID=UPI003D118A73